MFIKSFRKLSTVFCLCLMVIGSVASAKVDYTTSSAKYSATSKYSTYIRVNVYGLVSSSYTSPTSSFVLTDTIDYTQSYVVLDFKDTTGATTRLQSTLTNGGTFASAFFLSSTLPSTGTFSNYAVSVSPYYTETLTDVTGNVTTYTNHVMGTGYSALSQTITRTTSGFNPYLLVVKMVGTQSS